MSTSDLTVAARLVAKLLAHRQTPQEEVAGVIHSVHSALSRLREPVAAAAEPVAEADEPQTTVTPRRKRRQPQEIAATEEVTPAAAPPPAPKLVRRADIMTAPAAPAAAQSPALAPAPQDAVRGVVKWFDPRAGKGALRLPGFSGDVLFEARLLADSGIARLFKGQEIEATIDGGNGRPPKVQRITLPGGVTTTPVGAGIVHSRRAKPVLVELKREALRRAAARAEAEHLLGPGRSR